MRTVICAFDDRQTARLATDRLIEHGFARGSVHLQAGADAATATSAAGGAAVRNDGGFLSGVGNFFSSLFGSDSPAGDAGTYSEAVRRGSTVVVVDAVSDDEAERAAQVMDELGAVDIDERAAQWKSSGWVGLGANARPIQQEQVTGDQSAVLNVVQEELEVGKRTVESGRVRVIQRVVETPVSELVQLRQERATIERRAVDRPATEADFSSFKDGAIEVRETDEQAVVGKTARVVEEVTLGKEVQQRTETINDTVRRTDVEVERVEAGAATVGSAGAGTGMTDKLAAGYRDAKDAVLGRKP